ncbi:hypothetical protein [Spiroplasma melliferum]|uniref:Membrane protein n=2 Tax=Spiroplasma melliferum TaxID=2134 RepID=A0AAI9X0S2_SPIME|nr:hypothetical protein [Spiroplasma melliferum]ELL44158.1 putative transmembrane protein [Spiroplasma melliferum IPMB4A]KAI92289.1 membrane protein [Spiroplasma melliferum KC3]QCO23718.1 hypothetical protein SRED_002192 [Spiroplasma melliferum]
MGTLLGILGSLGFISSGATSAAATVIPAGTYIIQANASSMIDLVTREVSGILNANSTWIVTIEKAIYAGEKLTSDVIADAMIVLEEAASSTTEVLLSNEAMAVAAETLSIPTAVEGGIFAGSLGTAVETLGISLAIAAAIYGGYYAYTHWDDIKQFTSDSLKKAESYLVSANDYFKKIWHFVNKMS